eukprot:SAG11_NODE_1724_length_4373_cov_6.385587_2_plen_127_part_01
MVEIRDYEVYPLECSVSDGHAVAEKLRELEDSTVVELTDTDGLVSVGQMMAAFERFKSEVFRDPVNTIATIQFFGHSVHCADDGHTYLCPQNIFNAGSRLASVVRRQALSVQAMLRHLAVAAPRAIL